MTEKLQEQAQGLVGLCRAQAMEIGAATDPLTAVENTDWDERREFPDWRHHVDVQIIEIWQELSLEARLAIYLDASIHAFWSYS